MVASVTRRSFPAGTSIWRWPFAQLTYREGLRDIKICLGAVGGKLYHIGFRARVARSTLADANETRDWRIYADFAQALMATARTLYAREPLGIDLEQSLYALDSTTIDLCSGAVPVGAIPAAQGGGPTAHAARSARQYSSLSFHHRRQGARRERAGRDRTGGGCVLSDGPRLHRFRAAVRAHAQFGLLCGADQIQREVAAAPSHAVDKSTGLRSDQTVLLSSFASDSAYPDALRRVSYVDATTKKRLKFLTNNFTLPAPTIAAIDKQRWQVELFFKWIKQHLRIKAFYGTSENAGKTQIWIAVSVYVLVAILRKRHGLESSLY